MAPEKGFEWENGDVVDFPKIWRKKSGNCLAPDFSGVMEDESVIAALKRSTFMRIIGCISSGKQNARHCVDYCLDVLLF